MRLMMMMTRTMTMEMTMAMAMTMTTTMVMVMLEAAQVWRGRFAREPSTLTALCDLCVGCECAVSCLKNIRLVTRYLQDLAPVTDLATIPELETIQELATVPGEVLQLNLPRARWF